MALATLQAFAWFLGVLEWPLGTRGAWLVVLAAAALGALVAGPAGRRRGTADRGRPGGPDLLVRAVALAGYGLSWWVGLLAPDRSSDGPAYHIPMLAAWLEKGYVHWIDPLFQVASAANGYPKAAEAVAFVLATAVPGAHQTANLLFLPLGVLAVVALARGLGASSAPAHAAGALFLLAPLNIFQAHTTYVDAAFASAGAAWFAHLQAVLAVSDRSGVPGRRLSSGLAASAALVIATKGTGLLLVAAGAVVLAVAALRSSPRRSELMRALSAAALMALCWGGLWHLRNACITGSPTYPLQLQLGGVTLGDGWTLEDVLNEDEDTPERMRRWAMPARVAFTWVQSVEWWHRPLRGGIDWYVDRREAGLGYVWALGAVPALAWMALRAGPAARRLLLVGAVALAATPLPWWARFTGWLLGLGLPCLAVALTEAARRRSPAGRAWGQACFLAAVVEGGTCHYRVVEAYYGGPWPPPSATALARPENWQSPPQALFAALPPGSLDELLGQDAGVVVGPLVSILDDRWRHNLLGVLASPPGRRSVSCQPGLVAGDLERWFARGDRYLVWDLRARLPPSLEPAARRCPAVADWLVLRLERARQGEGVDLHCATDRGGTAQGGAP